MTSKMFLILFASYDGSIKREGHCGREEVGHMSLIVTDHSQSKVTGQGQATARLLCLLAYSSPEASDQILFSSGQTLRKTYGHRSGSARGRPQGTGWRVTVTIPSIFLSLGGH